MLRRLLGRMSARSARDLGPLLERARQAAERGDARRARALLERARALHPTSPGVQSDLGNVHLLLGEEGEAERSYAAALAHAPAHAAALTNLGLLRAGQGDRAAALDWFRRAVRADPWAVQAIRVRTSCPCPKGDPTRRPPSRR